MYSESYFEKALVPKEVRTCRDLNAIREETAKEQKGRIGNVIKWEISKRNVTTPTNDANDRNPSTPKLFLQYFDSPSPLQRWATTTARTVATKSSEKCLPFPCYTNC